MIYSINSLSKVISKSKQQGQAVVLATGFFDLLHTEHRNFLVKAKAQGDILIVAVESDARARALKGEGRPIEPQAVRCKHIQDLHIADYIIALDDNFNNFVAYESLMSKLRPNIYAVSAHSNHQANKKFLTEKYGGQLRVVHEFNQDISTTQIINHQNQL